MRVLVLYAHPVETSFGAAIHERVVGTLRAGGHDVDDCDLYAENFDPRLSREERLLYHEVGANLAPVADHVERLRAAEALVLCFPVWNFGYPAILKGYFDRVFLPGVSFDLRGGKVYPSLKNLYRIAAVTTYGGSRMRAMLAGDPPRKSVTRVLRAHVGLTTPVRYLALYDMNRATDLSCERFLTRVGRAMAAFANDTGQSMPREVRQ
ncbi:MAG TPA: NAD(P)H-dependent oxidoreductase [Propylenella sp.]|nr:NAD(P)H-dependent oxidoreductase [Propylenella sp.]